MENVTKPVSNSCLGNRQVFPEEHLQLVPQIIYFVRLSFKRSRILINQKLSLT